MKCKCNNYRRVTLLSVPGKVLALVLLNRIHNQLLQHKWPEQSGLYSGRALELPSEEAELLGLQVSLVKKKIQGSWDALHAAIESVPVAGENVEVEEQFICIGSVAHQSVC